MSVLATSTAPLRASDVEREHTASSLRDHAAAGRLDMDELGARLDVAYSARTRDQLSALLADLPGSGSSQRRDGTKGRRGLRAHRDAYLAVGALMVAIWALTGAGYFWPLWPLLGWGIGLRAHRRACGRPARAALE